MDTGKQSEVPDFWQSAIARLPNLVSGHQCILLSFFSGVEVAALAVHQLIGPPLLHLTWEVDDDCCAVISHHFPNAVNRGDVLKEDAKDIAHLLDRHDPHGAAMVLCTSSPPCPDFSGINSSAQGLAGQEGSKFGVYADLITELESLIGQRVMRHLTENVVMQQRSEATYLSKKLRAQPVLVDSSDFGLISRPRLWWLRLEWSDYVLNPISNKDLRWGKCQGYPQLHIDSPCDDVASWDLAGVAFNSAVLSGHHKMPCLTTPAPDERGRPAPKRSRGKVDEATRNRWLRDNRCFAPWHYVEQSMMIDEQHNLIIPPVEVKERMHHMPPGFTGVAGASDRARHTMLGNSWHLGVAKFLLLFVLQWSPSTSMPTPPKVSSLQLVTTWSTQVAPSLGPAAWQQEVFALPPAVDHQEDGSITQVPVMMHLLRLSAFPNIADLEEDMTIGFDVLGRQHPGPGWMPRLDGKYSDPLDVETFLRCNREYIFGKLRQSHIDAHWSSMLDEILQEREQGKLSGPYASPDDWPVRTVSVAGLPLLPTPPGWVCPAWSFSVQQSDKIRRCEDYRRSWHNATVGARDSPHHHTIESYTALARAWISGGFDAVVWAHDMHAAYRQIAVRDPQFSFVVLTTPGGHTLWRHNAMSFGATASVWAFNRMADSVMFLGRQLLLSPILHYVDDYGGVEPSATAHSTFQGFADLAELLGLKMKPKKACSPQPKLKMLGVFIHCLPREVQLQPCPGRVQKLSAIMMEALQSNRLSPEAAHRLAGKLVFLQTTVFGGVGKAALQVVYSRSAQSSGDHEQLTHALRSALMTLVRSLKTMRPRVLPVEAKPLTVLYTDAFFALGDCGPLKPESAPLRWKPEFALRSDHGWGYVLSVQGHTFYAFGKAPQALLRKYCKRKAFIYFLEMLAPILVVASCHRMMTPFVVSFIDNQSGLAAISKGYGSDPAINGIIAFFWSLMSALGMFAHFEWVPSHLNISDPISRRDTNLAENHGWMLIDIDLDPVYETLLRCAGDLQYATQQAVSECLALDLMPSLLQGLVQSGEIGPEAVDSGAH